MTWLVAGSSVCQVIVVLASVMSESDTFWITGGMVSLVRMKMMEPISPRHKMMAAANIFCNCPDGIGVCFFVGGL